MYLRVKKKKQSDDRMSYAFSIVESHRENGKVKQKIVKYLSSFVDDYQYKYRWITDQSVKDGHKAQQRLFFWLDIHNDLNDIDIDSEKLKDIVNKIKALISFPTENDLKIWIQVEWGASNIFGDKYKDSTQEQIDNVTERFNKMCSAYCRIT